MRAHKSIFLLTLSCNMVLACTLGDCRLGKSLPLDCLCCKGLRSEYVKGESVVVKENSIYISLKRHIPFSPLSALQAGISGSIFFLTGKILIFEGAELQNSPNQLLQVQSANYLCSIK